MGRREVKIMDTVEKIDKDKLIKHIIRWLNINIDYYDPNYFEDYFDYEIDYSFDPERVK